MDSRPTPEIHPMLEGLGVIIDLDVSHHPLDLQFASGMPGDLTSSSCVASSKDYH